MERIMGVERWTGPVKVTVSSFEMSGPRPRRKVNAGPNFMASLFWGIANHKIAERRATITPPKEISPSGASGHE